MMMMFSVALKRVLLLRCTMVSVVHCLALMSMLLLASSSSSCTVECVAKEAAVIALELAQVPSAAALCVADDEALAALREDEADNITVSYTPEIGYGFVDVTANVTRGLVFLPELGVAPEAYAVYARSKKLMRAQILSSFQYSKSLILKKLFCQSEALLQKQLGIKRIERWV
jgi:hypothetical protein